MRRGTNVPRRFLWGTFLGHISGACRARRARQPNPCGELRPRAANRAKRARPRATFGTMTHKRLLVGTSA